MRLAEWSGERMRQKRAASWVTRRPTFIACSSCFRDDTPRRHHRLGSLPAGRDRPDLSLFEEAKL